MMKTIVTPLANYVQSQRETLKNLTSHPKKNYVSFFDHN